MSEKSIWFTEGYAEGSVGNSTTAFNGALAPYHPTKLVKVRSKPVSGDSEGLQIEILEGDNGKIKNLMESLVFKKHKDMFG